MNQKNIKLQNVVIKCQDSNKLKILDIQEKERQRIARDLHDYSLQNLTHLIHKLELCSMEMDDDVIQAKLEIASIRNGLKQIIDDIRDTIFDLRPMPFDDLGVQEVFSRLQEKLQSMSDMEIHFNIGEIHSENSVSLMTIFRIIQECSLNSIKHSGGTKLNVTLKESDQFISVIIEDDGNGFDIDNSEKEGHFGLRILKERVMLLSGKLNLSSDSNGTKTEIIIPLCQQ